ncbi:Testis-expressed sequence 11 [Paramuricea clavata]|uniref:Protein ZIP4 homolog n=1 Tax=Paramuricea clavata TaxID=317549 RepID=A0A6S7G770_PARCT|nr:Testis-expressed sequence 11 [Paramuricea clavata]
MEKDSHLNTLISRLKVLTKNLSQSKVESDADLDNIWSIVEELQKISFNKDEHCSALIQIHTCAVTLWNLAVGMKTEGSGNLTLNAKLRHGSCNLVSIANTVECTEASHKKQLVMATKTGRAWLDCDNPAMAETSLELAEECWENLSRKLSTKQSSQEKLFIIEECEKHIFRTYCYQAEVATANSKYEKAKQYINKAKSLLGRHPKESCCLAMVCYNFGVDTFQRQHYEECVEWLRESYELGKGEYPLDSEKQATTLRLLANAYLEWDHTKHWDTALNAVGLANTEHLHPAGLYLKAKILLLRETSSKELQFAFLESLRHQELTVDMGLSIVELAIEYKKTQLAFEGLKQLANAFQNTPDLSKIQLQHLELLVQHNQEEEAKNLVEHCIEGHNTGRPLDPETKKKFHNIIWDKAASKCEENKHSEALEWYNYSLSLFSPGERQSINAGKLHRNICSCHIALKDMEKARQSITEAESSDHGNPLNSYFDFKLALSEKNNSKAITAMNKMSENHDKLQNTEGLTIHDIICLAAQLALENNNQEVAIPALESIIKHSPDNKQVITAIRCLIRLKMSFLTEKEKRNDVNTTLFYLKTALDKLAQVNKSSYGEHAAECIWFMKIAWNLALESKGLHQEMHELFVLTDKFAKLCPQDKTSLLKQKSSLFMAAGCCLEIAKEQKNMEEKKKCFMQVLDHVNDCRKILQLLNKSVNQDQQNTDDVPVVLSVYEFDAKANLNYDDVECLLDQISKLPNTDGKTFETIAALSTKLPNTPRNIQITKNALVLAIRTHCKNNFSSPDYLSCSKSYRGLIEICLRNGASGDVESKEESWSFFQEVANLIESDRESTIPEIEIQWLMTKSWNTGVHLYGAGKYQAAEKWCGMGMRLLKQLSDLKHFYETKMTELYSEILLGIESGRTQMLVEE